MSGNDPRVIRVACAVYAGAMRRLEGPDPDTRREMERTFRLLCVRAAREHGLPGVAWRTAEELADLVRMRVRARRAVEWRGGAGMAGQAVLHALRSIRRRPGYAITFIVTMGAGIGVNAAMLPVVSAAALRPLPYRNAERLSQIWSRETATDRDGPTIPAEEFLAWREHADIFESFEGFTPEVPRVLSGPDEPRQIHVARVTTGLFEQLGVAPVLGRTFEEGEGLPGGPSAVVVGHGLWLTAFGGAPDVIGRTVRLDDVDHTVVGVMPPGFAFPYGDAEAWLPVAPTPAGLQAAELAGLAHLRPGLTRESAESLLSDRLRAEADAEPAHLPLVMDLVFMRTPETTRRTLTLLFGAVLFVLLIATANVLSLGVAEASRRHRELAVMATLGAGRKRLLGQLLAEAGLLSIAGAGLGLLLAWLALAGLVPLIPEGLNLITGGRAMALWPDGVTMAALAAAAAAPLVGGLTALLARVGGTGALARQATGADRRSSRIQHGLVAGQVALSLLLLAGAGLLLNSFSRLIAVDPVVAADRLLLVSVRLPGNRYPEPAHRSAAAATMREALASLPGVRSVTATSSTLPLTRARFRPELQAEGGTSQVLDDFLPYHEVDAHFFRTLGIGLIAGRPIGEADEGRPVAVVNEVMARRLWPGASALERRFRVAADQPWLTVIGISEDVPQIGLRDPWGEAMEFYVPAPEKAGAGWTFAVRTDGPPALLAAEARRAIWSVDPQQPLERVTTYQTALGDDLGRERFFALLLTAFAVLATLLAAVGIHAVVAQVVANRTREIGIRAALGAGRLRIVRAATGPGLTAVAIGIAAGIAAALALTRLLESLLFGVEPRDPAILGLNVAVILIVAAAAVAIPVRRALAVEPVRAMRAE